MSAEGTPPSKQPLRLASIRLACSALTSAVVVVSAVPVRAQEAIETPTLDVSVEERRAAEQAQTQRSEALPAPEWWAAPADETDSQPEAIPDDPPPEHAEHPDIVPTALPGDLSASAATPQHISLPNAEGSVEGMGESFSPVLSSGTGTYSVPIALPAGRAGVQPSLSLSYSTSGGNTCVGFGWNFSVPFISRQTDRGLPQYDDRAAWHRGEDRFIYNGGQELVPVDSALSDAIDDGYTSAEFGSWQQYRARVEGGFLRFYRAPDARRWVVEGPDGSRLEFGELDASTLPSDFGASSNALETELPSGEGRVHRWFLTRMSDRHGSTVYYRYLEDGGYPYLSDVHYASPHSCAAGGDVSAQRHCAAPLSEYGRRVSMQYESREDVFASYIATWRIEMGLRLVNVAVSAAEGAPGTRTMVRRYHLQYDATSFHSLLSSVQVEGRPDSEDASAGARVGDPSVPESALISSSVPIGPLLPAMTFGYSSADATSTTVAGFGGIDTTVHDAPASPDHSLDEGRADFYDVNSDGLVDLLVTDPARFSSGDGPAVGVYFNGFKRPEHRAGERGHLLIGASRCASRAASARSST